MRKLILVSLLTIFAACGKSNPGENHGDMEDILNFNCPGMEMAVIWYLDEDGDGLGNPKKCDTYWCEPKRLHCNPRLGKPDVKDWVTNSNDLDEPDPTKH